MGKKYIIELNDECKSKFKGIMVFGLTQEKQISVELIPEESMTPYTEPDTEKVREEAYRQGYDTGYGTKVNEFYEQGLADAWDAARKIGCFEIDGGYPTTQMLDLFDRDDLPKILSDYTASEAIEKIRQYEQEKEEQMQVGDEVKCIKAKWKSIITKIGEDGYLTLMDNKGAIANCYDKKDFIKTGRHFSEIAEVLRKMREGQEQ